MKRKDLLFYILLLLISIPVSAGWQRPVTNYTRHTYKSRQSELEYSAA